MGEYNKSILICIYVYIERYKERGGRDLGHERPLQFFQMGSNGSVNPLAWASPGDRSFDPLETRILCGIITNGVWIGVSFKNHKSVCTFTEKKVHYYNKCVYS